jgi:PAS domain S-box-containing protein
VLYNASVYRDETGKVSGVFAAARDITERKRAEEELRKHREHLEELVEQRTRELRETEERAEREYTTIVQTALDGFWVDDLKGRILDVNDSYCKMTGYSREELLTMSIPDIEASERPEDVARHIDKIMNHGYDRFETRHRRKDGTPIEVEVSVNYSEIGGGRLIVFVRDITARKRAEEALRESEGKLRLMFESINDGIVVTDLNGVIIETNARAVRMGACSSKEGLLGRGSLELIAPREHERAAANLQKTLEQGAISNMEYTLTVGITRPQEMIGH